MTAWQPNYVLARKLKIDGSALGRLTGACKVAAGEATIDVGLFLRSGTNLCIADMARPSPDGVSPVPPQAMTRFTLAAGAPSPRGCFAGAGWRYSPAALEVLRDFIKAFPWLPKMLDSNDSSLPDIASAFPGLDAAALEAKATEVARWRDSCHALIDRKLSSTTSLSLPAGVVREINDKLGAFTLQQPPPITLDRVKPALLLPPFDSADISVAVAAESVQLGDIVVSISGSGDAKLPLFGAPGVVVAVHDGFAEVLFGKPFPGGTTLEGRIATTRGATLPLSQLLNVTTPSPALSWATPGVRVKAEQGSTASRSRAPLMPPAVNVPGPGSSPGFTAPSFGRGSGSLLPPRQPVAPVAPTMQQKGARRSTNSAPQTSEPRAPIRLAPFNVGVGQHTSPLLAVAPDANGSNGNAGVALLHVAQALVAVVEPSAVSPAMQQSLSVWPHPSTACLCCLCTDNQPLDTSMPSAGVAKDGYTGGIAGGQSGRAPAVAAAPARFPSAGLGPVS